MGQQGLNRFVCGAKLQHTISVPLVAQGLVLELPPLRGLHWHEASLTLCRIASQDHATSTPLAQHHQRYVLFYSLWRQAVGDQHVRRGRRRAASTASIFHCSRNNIEKFTTTPPKTILCFRNAPQNQELFSYRSCFQNQAQNNDQQEEEEEDYIDSDDEREDGEKAPHENAFVYIDESGKLVYVEPEEEEGGEGDVKGGGVAAGLEEKEVGTTQRQDSCGLVVGGVDRDEREPVRPQTSKDTSTPHPSLCHGY